MLAAVDHDWKKTSRGTNIDYGGRGGGEGGGGGGGRGGGGKGKGN